jgi:predicted TIM-barrel fold metal-dependent hydrolase
MTTLSSSEPPSGVGPFDVDVWGEKPRFVTIAQHMPDTWREWLRLGQEFEVGGRTELPESQYFLEGPALRQAADSNPQAALSAYLDRQAISRAIFNPGAAASVAGLASPMLSSEVAHAVNLWTLKVWLPTDRRLLGSMLVSMGDPRRAAAEIRQMAGEARFAQIVVAYPPRLLADRRFHPIYEAAAEVGLPLMLQAGGDFSGSNGGVTVVGHPTSTFEAHVAWGYAAAPHLIALITNGTFDRFSGLRVVFNGFGVAWLASTIWRLDDEFRSGRLTVPESLTRLPSEYLADHVRFTTEGLELPAQSAHLAELLAATNADRLLMFGSGPLREVGERELHPLPALPTDLSDRMRTVATDLYANLTGVAAPSA